MKIPRVVSPHEKNLEAKIQGWRALAKELRESIAAYLDSPSGEALGSEGRILRNLNALLLEGVKAACKDFDAAEATALDDDAMRGGQATKPDGS